MKRSLPESKGAEKLSISRISFPSASIMVAETPKTGEMRMIKIVTATTGQKLDELLRINNPPAIFL